MPASSSAITSASDGVRHVVVAARGDVPHQHDRPVCAAAPGFVELRERELGEHADGRVRRLESRGRSSRTRPRCRGDHGALELLGGEIRRAHSPQDAPQGEARPHQRVLPSDVNAVRGCVRIEVLLEDVPSPGEVSERLERFRASDRPDRAVPVVGQAVERVRRESREQQSAGIVDDAEIEGLGLGFTELLCRVHEAVQPQVGQRLQQAIGAGVHVPLDPAAGLGQHPLCLVVEQPICAHLETTQLTAPEPREQREGNQEGQERREVTGQQAHRGRVGRCYLRDAAADEQAERATDAFGPPRWHPTGARPNFGPSMSVPVARQDPHLRRFPLRRRIIHAAGGPLRLVVPASSHALLADSPALARAAAGGEFPHWADVWPASVALARRLLRGERLEGRTVVDLGCGLGVAGIGAGRRGAAVRFLDRSEDALRFAAFNARQARLDAWSTAVFHWAEDTLPEPVDLLLLGDVLYSWKHGPSLLRHVDAVVRGGGTVLCADPCRPTGDDFFAEIARRWPATRCESCVVTVEPDGARVDVRLAEVVGERR